MRFQSLFLWISLYDMYITEINIAYSVVSILVLMDFPV